MSALSRTFRALCYLAFRNDPIARRYRSDWLHSLRRPDPLVYARPWITYAAIEWAEQHIHPEMRIFEWGCGGSTLFWARRAQSVVAVEHEEAWANRVNEALAEHDLPHARCMHIPAPPVSNGIVNGASSDEDSYLHRTKSALLDCRAYVSQIDDFDDQSFDLVVVDGICRPQCVRHALTKIREGGYLMLDNSDRREYDEVRTWLKDLPCCEHPGITPYKTLRSQTTIWQITGTVPTTSAGSPVGAAGVAAHG